MKKIFREYFFSVRKRIFPIFFLAFSAAVWGICLGATFGQVASHPWLCFFLIVIGIGSFFTAVAVATIIVLRVGYECGVDLVNELFTPRSNDIVIHAIEPTGSEDGSSL